MTQTLSPSSMAPSSTPHETHEAIVVHADSYHRFMLGLKWVVVYLATAIAWFTAWFATDAGFWGGLLTGAVVYAGGVFAMTRGGLAHSTERDNPGGL
jgi:hypothetical protein